MRMTRQAEIAIDVLVLCALKAGSTTPVTTQIAADHAGTTKNHAAQVVARLSRNFYLVSERGRAGGLRLGRPADEINIGAVLRLTDPVIGGVLGQDTATPAFSALRRAAWETYLSTFDGFTIADLVIHPKHSRTNCLDCDLTRLVRHGRTMSRLHDHVGCRTPFSGPDAGATA
ncbi:Rrf2 family nitric oxide-sensitive transcriptional repressor [Aquamicrobium lusatiense]|uniref:Rrf2 family nitric oxide-sensitive transcriptional repressor n=1 Tax=Aquamicrobium lusatiense TaxID=89772 RepID=A0A7W9S2X4_9HYPH|nr:Rrf2 family transcriptional regulator [Aquamicrobium lusatiense]MBB6012374.1 Rrf2 family nitric oxide-sensitive transcriptional repressor [Aquamicrobium lusatiense]